MATHVFHLYVVRSQRRELLIRFLREKEVGALVHYRVPVHLQPAYQEFRVGEGGLMGTERAAQEIISLPTYPGLTGSELETVIDAIEAFGRAK